LQFDRPASCRLNLLRQQIELAFTISDQYAITSSVSVCAKLREEFVFDDIVADRPLSVRD